MPLTVLLTGSTDGIGLVAASSLAARGHTVLLHGRSDAKFDAGARHIRDEGGTELTERYRADLSSLEEVESLAEAVAARHDRLDVLINNAGGVRLAIQSEFAPF